MHASTLGLSASRTVSVQGRSSQTSVACFQIEFIMVFNCHPLLLVTPFSAGLKGSYTTQHLLPVQVGVCSQSKMYLLESFLVFCPFSYSQDNPAAQHT